MSKLVQRNMKLGRVEQVICTQESHIETTRTLCVVMALMVSFQKIEVRVVVVEDAWWTVPPRHALHLVHRGVNGVYRNGANTHRLPRIPLMIPRAVVASGSTFPHVRTLQTATFSKTLSLPE